jgi:tRNA-2-methylthio-N6-dimethylallyladenosine synthase
VVIGPDNIPELAGLVAHAQAGAPPIARTVFDVDDPRFLDALPAHASCREITSFVTVMKGCDERCTFCIVPYTRGPERYRAADAIVSEIRGMVEGGVREVTLLGQTVNSWYEPGTEHGERGPRESGPAASQFASLLRRIAAEIPSLARLRYTSPHPRHVTEELVRAHAELEVLPAHVHLPVQSGSDRVLKRMLRRYTRALFVERARALRSARAGLTLSTDLIVGFPGETDADFEETLSLVREVGFVAAFAFKYSPRPYTPALKLGDDVPEAVKDERLARLLTEIGAQQRAHLASLVGSRTTVLFEGPSDQDKASALGTSRWRGRSSRHEIVHVDVARDIDLGGELLPVSIERANAHSLIGTLVDVAEASLPRKGAIETPRALGRVKLPVVGRGERAAGAPR